MTYFVLAAGLTPNQFEISSAPGGTASNFTGTSSGTQTGITIQEMCRTKGNAILDAMLIPGGANTKLSVDPNYAGKAYLRALVNLGSFSGANFYVDFTNAGGTLGQNI
jgi:hypothetical protein